MNSAISSLRILPAVTEAALRTAGGGAGSGAGLSGASGAGSDFSPGSSSGASSGSSSGPSSGLSSSDAQPEFSDVLHGVLHSALDDMQNLQGAAETKVAGVLDGTGTDVHSALIAVEKADLSFQLMMQVRNKIVSAYQEISRMQF